MAIAFVHQYLAETNARGSSVSALPYMPAMHQPFHARQQWMIDRNIRADAEEPVSVPAHMPMSESLYEQCEPELRTQSIRVEPELEGLGSMTSPCRSQLSRNRP